ALEGVMLTDHLLHVLREHRRKGRLAVMETKELTPKVLRPCDEVRADTEDVRQHELLGRRFAQRLMRVPRLRLEQRGQHLTTQLPHHGIAQPREQLSETQGELARLTQVVPRQVGDRSEERRVAKENNQRTP